MGVVMLSILNSSLGTEVKDKRQQCLETNLNLTLQSRSDVHN